MNTNDKLDKIIDDLSDIKEIQVKHEANLQEHMRRTVILEKEMRPMVKHVMMVKGAGAFIGLLAVIAGIYRSFS